MEEVRLDGDRRDEERGDGWEDDEAIYARFAGPLYRFLHNKVPPNERDELLQDTFLRFIEKRRNGQLVDRQGQRFEGPGPLLFGIARMLLLEFLRKLVKADAIDDIDGIMAMPLADINPGLHSQISAAEKSSVVHECLREIPFHEQMVLECHYLQRMSYKELACFLAVPIGTIASWCRRGRESLRARLEDQYRGKQVPAGFLETDDPRHGAVAAYVWYEPATGAVDHEELVRVITRVKRRPSRLPAWFVALELPRTLPEASAGELWELARGVWEAWVEAGRPVA
jgi:RNA polymerase sigma factor (sigma-70 family)